MEDILKLDSFYVDAGEGFPPPVKTHELQEVVSQFGINFARVWTMSMSFQLFVRGGQTWALADVAANMHYYGKPFMSFFEPKPFDNEVKAYRNALLSGKVDPPYHTCAGRPSYWLDAFNETWVKKPMESILSSCIIGIWTAFEVLAGDLWESALNLHPRGLAGLKGQPWRRSNESNEEDSESGEVSEQNDMKSVRLEFILKLDFDVRNKMGTLLRRKFHFDSLVAIQQAYARAWSEKNDQDRLREILRNPDLDLLQAVRNLLAHRGGVVDDKFLRRITQKSTKQLDSRFKGAAIGQPLPINGVNASQLINSAFKQSCTLLGFVDSWLVSH